MRALASVSALLVLCGTADSKALIGADEPPVTVQGVLQLGQFFGSPGYGENLPDEPDALEQVYYLQLPATVLDQNPAAKFGREYKDFPEYFVQLAIFPSNTPARLRSLVGRKVRVIGVARANDSAGHRTAMVLLVDKLVPVTEWKWLAKP